MDNFEVMYIKTDMKVQSKISFCSIFCAPNFDRFISITKNNNLQHNCIIYFL